MRLEKRKGLGTGGRGGGKLKKLLEGSTIVDLLTLAVLIYDFMLLRSMGSGYGTVNLFRMPTSQEILAAQLTGLVVAIYIVEAVIDSAGSDH